MLSFWRSLQSYPLRVKTRASPRSTSTWERAIVFDFVNPVLAPWWLINQGGKLWLDKPEPCRKHYFWYLFGSLTEEAPDGECQGFFRS
jgi:hypothetical protein